MKGPGVNSTNPGRAFRILAFSAMGLWPAGIAAQGFVELKDGRYVVGSPVVLLPDGIRVDFPDGPVRISSALVRACVPTQCEGCEPPTWSPEDQARIDNGLVPLQGKWVRRSDLESRWARRLPDFGAAKKVDERFAWKNHKVRKSRTFEFHYTVADARIRALEDLMEAFATLVTRDLKLSQKSVGPLRVNFFHDEATLRDVCMGKVHKSSGQLNELQSGHDLEINLHDGPLGDLTVPYRIQGSLLEFALFRSDPKFRYPDWIVGSLADAYGNLIWNPARREFDRGGPHLDHASDVVQDLNRGLPQKVGDFFQTQSDSSVTYGRRGLGAVQAPWGCLLMDHLLSERKTGDRFRRFVATLPSSGSEGVRIGEFRIVSSDETRAAFRQHVGAVDSVEKEWLSKLGKMAGPESPEDLAWAGRLALTRGNAIKAEALLNAAVEKGNESAGCLFHLAQALFHRKQFKDAASALRRAIERDPLDGGFYYWLALCRILDAGSMDEESRRLLGLALEVQPATEGLSDAVEFDLTRFQ